MEQLGDLDGKTVAELITAVVALATVIFSVMKYISRRDKQVAAREVFRTVVDSLSSSVEIQRLGGAILLRRFFDPDSELGQGKTPYMNEAIDVIAAILRDVETGNFQKLLADGLRYAPSLERVDLQRTNLQKAYLGRKDQDRPNLHKADFFRADLSGASLKGAKASEAVFYQSRLHNTILKEADLSNASFYQADLLGANFKDANLSGANFAGARNLPSEIAEHIGSDGIFVGEEVTDYEETAKAYTDSMELVNVTDATAQAETINVFLSKPGTLNNIQRNLVNDLNNLLTDEGIDVITVERENYPGYGAVAEVRRELSNCAGAIILGFRQLEFKNAIWRYGTDEVRKIEEGALPTAWNHIEAGMAAMKGMPILFLVEKGVIGGLFDLEDVDHVVIMADLEKFDYLKFKDPVLDWCRAVREAAH